MLPLNLQPFTNHTSSSLSQRYSWLHRTSLLSSWPFILSPSALMVQVPPAPPASLSFPWATFLKHPHSVPLSRASSPICPFSLGGASLFLSGGMPSARVSIPPSSTLPGRRPCLPLVPLDPEPFSRQVGPQHKAGAAQTSTPLHGELSRASFLFFACLWFCGHLLLICKFTYLAKAHLRKYGKHIMQ